MTDYLARVAAIAAREAHKADADRDEMRRLYPGAAAAYDWAFPAFGRPPWIRDCASGREWGRRLPTRSVPPIPGLPNGVTGEE